MDSGNMYLNYKSVNTSSLTQSKAKTKKVAKNRQ